MKRLLAAPLMLLLMLLAACGGSVAPTATPNGTSELPAGVVTVGPSDQLSGIRSYLLDKLGDLKTATASLKTISDGYYATVITAGKTQGADIDATVAQAQAAWKRARPLFQQVRAIVAGSPHLSRYDLILDSGTPGALNADNAVPIDVPLPDGRVLVKPGSLFDVTASALWRANPDYIAPNSSLPDANVLKGAADALDSYSAELIRAAQDWTPSEPDAFTAFVTMTPAVSDYFSEWSKFRAAPPTGPAVSPLADLQGLLSGLSMLQTELAPTISKADPATNTQIGQELGDLQTFVADLRNKEEAGTAISAEQATLLSSEADDRATSITGQITQVMATLGVQIETASGAACTGGAVPAATATP